MNFIDYIERWFRVAVIVFVSVDLLSACSKQAKEAAEKDRIAHTAEFSETETAYDQCQRQVIFEQCIRIANANQTSALIANTNIDQCATHAAQASKRLRKYIKPECVVFSTGRETVF